MDARPAAGIWAVSRPNFGTETKLKEHIEKQGVRGRGSRRREVEN